MVTKDRQFPLSTPISTLFILIFIWTYSFLVSIPPLLGWGTFNKNNLHVSCGLKWDVTDTELGPVMYMAYVIYIYMFGFIIPVAIILTCYVKIIKTIKFTSIRRTSNSSTWKSPGLQSRVEKDRKLTIMVAVMIISFLVTWFPYACVSIAETAGYIPKTSLSFYILAIPTMLTKSAVCIDPIIYFGLNPQFRAEMIFLLGISAKQPHDASLKGIVRRNTVAEESDQTLRGVINTYLDTSSILGEAEVGKINKKREDKPLTVLTINPLTDEDSGLDQSTSGAVKKEGTEDTVEIIVEDTKEELVEIMVEEGKVLFIPKIENEYKL